LLSLSNLKNITCAGTESSTLKEKNNGKMENGKKCWMDAGITLFSYTSRLCHALAWARKEKRREDIRI
jgi:hypothetical protein